MMELHQQKKSSANHKRIRTIALTLLIVALVVLLWVWNNASLPGTTTSPSTTAQGNAAMQTNEGGQVTMKVTWQGRSAGPVFIVEMDTHAVDLDSYNLQKLAILRIDQGQEIQPGGWNAPTGGHHRTGTLTFPATTTSGTSVIGPKTRAIELIIRNISGIPERSFRWTL